MRRSTWTSAILALSLLAAAGCAGSGPPEPGRIDAGGSWRGVASYYSDGLHGRPTASGEPYDRNAYTAAHRTLAFGTLVRVTRPDNGRVVVVRINDRGPFVDGREIDLSRRAAEVLDFVRAGLVSVELRLTDERPGPR